MKNNEKKSNKTRKKKRRKKFKKKEEKKRENVKNKSARFMIKLYSFKRSKKVEEIENKVRLASGLHLIKD